MPCALASGTRGRSTRKPARHNRVALLRRKRAVVALAFSAMAALLGCEKTSGSSPGILVEDEVSPQPARVGPATITIRLTDASAKQISGARIGLEADMSHPGMSPVFGEAKEVEPGRYQGRIEFTMPGDWVVLLHITLADGRTLERQMAIKGVRAS
jgi:hypothetical protein